MELEVITEIVTDSGLSVDALNVIIENLELIQQTTAAMNEHLFVIRAFLSVIIVYGVFKVLFTIFGSWFFGGV